MAKKKVKEGPMGTFATEVYAGTWDFTTGKYKWRWSEGMGINLRVAKADDPGGAHEPAIYAKDLNHAIMFAQGFEGGKTAGGPGGSEGQDETPAQEDKKAKRQRIQTELAAYVEALDFDGVILELTAIAVAKRNAADEEEPGNPEEQKYLQAQVEAFTDFQERLETL